MPVDESSSPSGQASNHAACSEVRESAGKNPDTTAPTGAIADRRAEGRCPECRFPATRVLGYGGWLFRCSPCRREWGHPQGMSVQEATEILHDLRHEPDFVMVGQPVKIAAAIGRSL